ncbi:hypothetical protein [Clostridium celatum]|uniref:hypothetical protein n=1 Tax=Clostridium celatum TaxID=36834 RepID=UPI00291270E1|nr:hypothetical protein [Clostridium celatum]MDU6296830.1 hypothetical protein [Clostridium celatum]
MKDKERVAKAIIEMHDKLGHEKFNTVVKIFMDSIEAKKEKRENIDFKTIKITLEDAIKIANTMHDE